MSDDYEGGGSSTGDSGRGDYGNDREGRHRSDDRSSYDDRGDRPRGPDECEGEASCSRSQEGAKDAQEDFKSSKSVSVLRRQESQC